MTVYFDNAATTPLSPAAVNALTENMSKFGNPSSLHSMGQTAEQILESGRDRLKKSLKVKNRHDGLIFCGSGSEANNLAVMGCANSKQFFRGKKIITSATEHPSVENCVSELEKRGFKAERIPCPKGVFDMQAFENALDGNVFLVTVMTVNNETGAVYDIDAIRALMKRKCPDGYLHTDATQAYSKIRVDASMADMITFSGHKLGAPKGIGALYVSERVLKEKAISPVIFGGGQEKGLRSGTENVLFASAFAACGESSAAHVRENGEIYGALHENTVSLLSQRAAEVTVNRPEGDFSPHILSVTLPNIKSEVMLHYLSSKGIFVSSGSACSSHHKTASRTMLEFGLTERQADCTLRISFSVENTAEETEYFVDALAEGIKKLARISK